MRVVKACIHAGYCFPLLDSHGCEAATAASMTSIPLCQNTTMNSMSDDSHPIADIPQATIGAMPGCSLTGCPLRKPHANCHLQVGGVESLHFHWSAAPQMQVQHPHLLRPHAHATATAVWMPLLFPFGLFVTFPCSY